MTKPLKTTGAPGSGHPKLDRTDRRLLRLLQEDGTLTDSKLAEMVYLSPSGCRKRRLRLEDSGVIQGYSAVVDPERVGLPEVVFVVVKLTSNQHEALVAFDEAVQGVEEVMECRAVTGEWDYVLRVVTRDLHTHDRLCDRKLTQLPGVARVESLAAMRCVVRRAALPLDTLDGRD